MAEIKIADTEINNINPKKLELSISLATNGLSFLIYQLEINKILALSHFPKINNTKSQIEWIETNDLLKQEFAKIKIVISTPNTVIMPAAIFNINQQGKIYDLHFGNAESVEVRAYYMKKSDNFVVFGVDKNVYKCLNKISNSITYMSQTAAFIDVNITKLRLNKDKPKNTVYVNIYDSFFDIMCTEEDKLLLYNSFTYKSANDVVYYILSIFEQLKLSQEKTHIILSGLIEKDNLIVINLKKFVSFVYFESRNISFNYYYKFQDISPHYFYNFINSIECE
ncbi:MAG: DUF3822 family protein [Bacteroidales bacterium]|nr:DUF3822 family protein [Bacteroidales bacterium]